MTLSIFIDRDCPPGMSKCGDGSSCNYNPWFCNGRPECADGSDEDADFCSSRKFLFCVLENKGVWPVICEGWHYTQMWQILASPHLFTKREGLGPFKLV